MTVDQKASRRGPDLVERAVAELAGIAAVRAFERTAGDEMQAVLADAEVVVSVALDLVRSGQWSVGIGCGPVEEPLPAHSRAGRGEAFVLARQAVTRAKGRPERVALEAAGQWGQQADALLCLVSAVVQRRSQEGWQAVDLIDAGNNQTVTADLLGISKQAVNARLKAALWGPEQGVRPLLVDLVARCDEPWRRTGERRRTGESP